MKHHEHGHNHGAPHHHGQETPPHQAKHPAQDHHLGHTVGSTRPGLLMTSSILRVLGASALIALLWLAVAWAVLFVD